MKHPDVVVTRLEDGRFCATGMCSTNTGVPSWGFSMGYVMAQLAMTSPEAQALKPGESVTIKYSRDI